MTPRLVARPSASSPRWVRRADQARLIVLSCLVYLVALDRTTRYNVLMDYELTNFQKLLDGMLDPEMDKILDSVSRPTNDEQSSQYMTLPSDKDVDLGPRDVSRLIALSSNKYGESVRLASLARSKYKIAEARYKHKLKANSNNGKNKEEREANAANAVEEEHKAMVMASVVVEICESIESANRIASESSRRMLLAVDQSFKAQGRFDDNQGSLDKRDFNSW